MDWKARVKKADLKRLGEAKGVTADQAAALLEAAEGAMAHSHAPYSNFRVGAAVLTGRGRIYSGCNVENASYGGTMCAERTAIFKSVSEGHKRFSALAVIADYKAAVPPCGICRQVLSEFAPNALVIMANTKGDIEFDFLGNLLPRQFEL